MTRFAEWRNVTGPAGHPVSYFYPIHPLCRDTERRRQVTVRHAVACVDCTHGCRCAAAYEAPQPCPNPDQCSNTLPCAGRAAANRWRDQHATECPSKLLGPAPQQSRRPASARVWTLEEDQLLHVNTAMPVTRLARLVGCSPAAVKYRRTVLGLPETQRTIPTRGWELSELATLATARDLEHAMELLPGRSRASIRGAARRRGIKLHSRKAKHE